MHEKKVKERWLLATFVQLSCTAMAFLLALYDYFLGNINFEEFVVFGIGLLVAALLTFVLYKYSYKSFGTKWLFFAIAQNYLAIARQIIELNKVPFFCPTFVSVLIVLIVSIIWSYYSIKTVKINKSIKKWKKQLQTNCFDNLESLN